MGLEELERVPFHHVKTVRVSLVPAQGTDTAHAKSLIFSLKSFPFYHYEKIFFLFDLDLDLNHCPYCCSKIKSQIFSRGEGTRAAGAAERSLQ